MVGIGAALIAATGTLRGVAAAASFAILIYYAIANWAALRLAPADRLYPSIIPLAGLLVCVALATALSPRVIMIGMAVLLVGVCARIVSRWRTNNAAAGGTP